MGDVREAGRERIELREFDPIVTLESLVKTVEPVMTSVRALQLPSPTAMLSSNPSPEISTEGDPSIALDSTSIDLQFVNRFKSVVPSQSNPLEIMR